MEIKHKSYEEGIIEKLSEESPFDVERWYSSISEHTFLTEFLPLSIDEAIVLRQKYKVQVRNCESKTLEPAQAAIYAALSKRVGEFLTSKFKGKPVFVRLSTRSPKDTANFFEDPLLIEKNIRIVEAKLRELGVNREKMTKELNGGKKELTELISPAEMNAVVRTMLNAGKDQLKVIGDSSDKVLELLTTSERVSIDLHRMLVSKGVSEPQRIPGKEELSPLEYGPSNGADFLCNIIFREWQDVLDEEEYRCFYYQRKLNAISQYNYYIFLEELQEKEEQLKIQTAILSLFSKVKDLLPQENGVIDFQVKADGNVKIIELNPFNKYEGGGTGGALFRWREDWETLTKGPLEMRVVTQIYPEINAKLALFGLEQVVEEALDRILRGTTTLQQPENVGDRRYCCIF